MKVMILALMSLGLAQASTVLVANGIRCTDTPVGLCGTVGGHPAQNWAVTVSLDNCSLFSTGTGELCGTADNQVYVSPGVVVWRDKRDWNFTYEYMFMFPPGVTAVDPVSLSMPWTEIWEGELIRTDYRGFVVTWLLLGHMAIANDHGNEYTDTTQAAATTTAPEPGSWILLLAGLTLVTHRRLVNQLTRRRQFARVE